jgi:DNA-binding MarR family transcriptional regulator
MSLNLIELTSHGRTLFERSMALQRPWAAGLGRNLSASRLSEVCKTLEELLKALKGSEEAAAHTTGWRSKLSR